jgi:16S rRNA (guanine(966)-N(2))-methyltransferase RsmD
MVRIISGECRGRRLKTLSGKQLRPTSDRAKETLFDILQDRIVGCSFLDLFAGTGSMGLEAASRGAKEVVLVESHPEALELIAGNIRRCGLEKRVKVYGFDSGNSVERLKTLHNAFDIVFLDPPYGKRSAYRTVQSICDAGLLAKEGWVIAEHERRLALPPEFGTLMLKRARRVGDTVFSFYGARKIE